MKNYLLITVSFFAFFLVTSCKKNNEAPVSAQMDLTHNLSFKNYVARDMMEKLKVFEYNTNNLNANIQASFRSELSGASTLADIENVYGKYALNGKILKKFVLLHSAEQAKLIVDIPELRLLNDDQLDEIFTRNYKYISNEFFEHAKSYTLEKIKSGNIPIEGKSQILKPKINAVTNTEKHSVKLLVSNPDDGTEAMDFESLYYSIPTNMSESEIQAVVDEGLANFAIGYISNRITTDELFSCAREAFIALVGSVTGLTNLGKLIQMEGISAAIQAVSKFIVRNSGWVTAAILAADFGMCVYSASQN